MSYNQLFIVYDKVKLIPKNIMINWIFNILCNTKRCELNHLLSIQNERKFFQNICTKINLTFRNYRKVYYSNKMARIRYQQYVLGCCHQYYTQINYCINRKKTFSASKL